MWYNRPGPMYFMQYRINMYKVIFLVLAAAPAEAWTPANPAVRPPFNFTDFVLLLGEFFNAEKKLLQNFRKCFYNFQKKNSYIKM